MTDPQDEAYLAALTDPAAGGYAEQWALNSRSARRAHPPQVLAYGTGTNEYLDVFEPSRPRATVMFLHCGLWQSFHAEHFSYLAPELLKDRVRLAVLDHDLAPDASITTIVAQARRATAVLAERYSEPLLVAGHSDGAHLAAVLCSTDWSEYGADVDIAGGLGLSGIYELEPLRSTSLQDTVSLTEEETAALSPVRLRPTLSGPFQMAIAELDPDGIRWQSHELAEYWPGVAAGPKVLAGHNHYTVGDEIPTLIGELLP